MCQIKKPLFGTFVLCGNKNQRQRFLDEVLLSAIFLKVSDPALTASTETVQVLRWNAQKAYAQFGVKVTN